VIGDRAADDSAGPLHTRLRALLGALSGMVGDRVLLFSLELQLAGKAFALILILLAGAAVAALTAWIALWLALAAWIMHNGWGWGWAALVVIAVNAAGAAFGVLKARSLFKLLTLPATLRHLTVPSVKESAAAVAATEPLR
jgi:uncharacterized membrane protein YqjE